MGLNVATAATMLAAIGFTAWIISRLSAPESESVSGVVLWLAQSLAWLSAATIVFIPLFAYNIRKVMRQERSVAAHLELAAQGAAAVDEQIKLFLRNTLKDQCYGVAKSYVFGSLIAQYTTRDVDVIIQFESGERGRLRAYRERLRSVESSFQKCYSLKLHLQLFLPDEHDALEDFLREAGSYERIT